MAGIDISTIVGGQNASLANAQSQMASDFSQINTLSKQTTDATQAAGTDEGIVATQQAKGLLDAQTAAQQVATSYGGNPNDVSFIMNKLGQQWQDTEAQRLQALETVRQKQSVSFTDDPLTWFANKLSVNTDIAQYNDLEEKSNVLYDQLEKINTLNTSTAQSMKAIATTQTAATVKATADLALQKTTIAANEAQLKGILYNVQGIKDVTQLGQDQVDNIFKQTQSAIAAGHLAVAQQQLVYMKQEADQKAAYYAQQVKDKQAADASDADMISRMNQGFAAMGLPAIKDNTKAMNLLKIGGEPGEIAKQALSIGMMNEVTGKPIIAPTAGTSARILAMSNSPIAVANPAVKPVTDLLGASYALVRNPQNAAVMGINPKDPASLDAGISAEVQRRATQMAVDIKAHDASNIYQAPPLTALATMKGMQDNPLYKTVLAPQVKTGMAEVDPLRIAQLAIDAVNNKQISLNDAINGYQSMFSHAVALNNESKDFVRFGMTPQTSYNTDINGTGVFGGATRVDLTNRAQVATMFMKLSTGLGNQISSKLANEGFAPNASIFDVMAGNKAAPKAGQAGQ